MDPDNLAEGGSSLDQQLRSAQAADRPCELHRYHSPKPSRTQGHHRAAVYLQNRVYGKIVIGDLLWVCGTDHDSIHDWLSWLLGEARKPDPEPGRLVKAEAQRTFEWYAAATADRAQAVLFDDDGMPVLVGAERG